MLISFLSVVDEHTLINIQVVGFDNISLTEKTVQVT